MDSLWGGHIVLTYNPKYPTKNLLELLDFIKENSLPVYLNQSAGFGAPELRVGVDYIKGVSNIIKDLKTRFPRSRDG